jgi:HlyD family secretion protein
MTDPAKPEAQMPERMKPDLPLDLGLSSDQPRPPRRWFRKRYLAGAAGAGVHVFGRGPGDVFPTAGVAEVLCADRTATRRGVGPAPIALPPEIDLPPRMAETMLPTDVVGLARVMPLGDVSMVAAPYGAGDARVAEVLVAVGDRVTKGEVAGPAGQSRGAGQRGADGRRRRLRCARRS